MGWNYRCGSGHWYVQDYYHSRSPGIDAAGRRTCEGGESYPTSGGGRKSVTEIDPGILAALEAFISAHDAWRSGVAIAMDV